MKSLKKLLVLAIIGGSLTMLGCSAQKSEETKPKLNPKTSTNEKQPLTIKVGASNMKAALKEMKVQFANKEDDKAIATSEKLEENWSGFEDTVKSKSPTLYEKVEGPLGIIKGGVKIKPLDTKTLITAIDKLDSILTEVQNVK